MVDLCNVRHSGGPKSRPSAPGRACMGRSASRTRGPACSSKRHDASLARLWQRRYNLLELVRDHGIRRKLGPEEAPMAKQNKEEKRICDRCDHLERDHTMQGCLVCFKCSEFVAIGVRRKPLCCCLHGVSEHSSNTGTCRVYVCKCRKYRPLGKEPGTDSTSVRTIPGGGFESNRRRH